MHIDTAGAATPGTSGSSGTGFLSWMRRLSLRYKLIGMVGLLLAFICAFLLVFLPGRMEEVARKWADRRAKDIALVISNAAGPGYEFDDAQNVDDILATLQTAPGALFAAVRKEDGQIFAAWKKDAVPEMHPVGADGWSLAEKGGELHVVAPIATKGGAKAHLQLGFSLAELQVEKRQILRTVFLMSVGIFGAGLFVSFFMGTLIVRPTRALTDVTTRIVQLGDLTQKIDVGAEDEIGQLASSFSRLVDKLKSIPVTLRESVTELSTAVESINDLTKTQTLAVQRQASSLAETSATTAEIKQTSALAASKAAMVLEVAKKAEEIGGAGQTAVDSSIAGLQEIKNQIDAIVTRTSDLAERTLQVGEIIETVKDLADQSNVLALNASIEAAKAGEFGKGFAVVAREIRSLADQSIQSTGRIREILSEIQTAIRGTVAITDEGKRKMEESMQQIRSSGENLKQVTSIVAESSQAARQIAASVNQQNAGITQISASITNLNAAMEDTTGSIRKAEGAVENLKSIAVQIQGIVESFRV